MSVKSPSRLVYVKAYTAWAFASGGRVVRLEGAAMFFELRDAAVDAAQRHGLTVSSHGAVEERQS